MSEKLLEELHFTDMTDAHHEKTDLKVFLIPKEGLAGWVILNIYKYYSTPFIDYIL